MERLRTGDISLFFDPETASLRYLTVAESGTEVLRGVYAAVRDADWGTVPFMLENVTLEQREDGFELAFSSVHRRGDIHFIWRGRVEGRENRLEFTFDGEAKTTFGRNRIGFCVLHPMQAAGARCVVTHTDGTLSEGRFPETIAPHQPFRDVRAIKHEVASGLWAEVMMAGDSFETEDQRNWTDASFKTYCTPLSEPFPVEVRAGGKVRQRVSLRLEGTPPPPVKEAKPTFMLMGERKERPHLGLGAGDTPLSDKVLEDLKPLNLDYLRVDVRLGTPYTALFSHKLKEAKALGVGLELALFHTEPEELETFCRAFPDVPVHRFLIFHEAEKSTSARTLTRARRALAPSYPDVPLFGGTDAFFTELNREPPPANTSDGLVYSLNPQVHAFDDASLIETLPAQALTVACARHLGGGKPVAVSPVTFKMRHNPNATGDASLSLAERTDLRQHALLGAAWTLGSLKYLLESPASSLTYFEAAGPLGLMSVNAEPYPLYRVFREIGALRGAEVVKSRSSHPLRVEGLMLARGSEVHLFLANLTAERQEVRLRGDFKGLRQRSLETDKAAEFGGKVVLEPYQIAVYEGTL